ncbi:MAG: methylisocitrate lyase [Trueperaceae bacterium]|nr:methylisocitrate lyase [Trueperaceae bacterium]
MLRDKLASGGLSRFPGAFSPLVAMLIEEQGFDGVYVSGAVLANDLGLPDIGLTTLSEVTQRAGRVARATNLPILVDIDTGFGEPLNVARTVVELEAAGLAGCHLEDQENPKRCGHLDHKTLVAPETMQRKISAAVKARQDDNFVLIARTDARSAEGIAGAVARARAYVEAGADVIFPEALANIEEFRQFRDAVSVPLLANMTEFGKSPLLNAHTLQDLGYNLVIYPVTSLRLAMKAVEDGLEQIKETGTQEALLPAMQTRRRLYELVKYEAYTAFDQDVFNFAEGLED